MAKTIIINGDGKIEIVGVLTDEEKIALGVLLYPEEGKDNDGQVIFYTGISSDWFTRPYPGS
jgi:hypothetical protein